MRIEEILTIYGGNTVQSFEGEVVALTYDSRAVEKGSCFFAIKGTVCDGNDFIGVAAEKGAAVVVCERMPEGDELRDGVTYVVVESAQKAMAQVAKAFYGDASRELKLVGITGTNGKTTTATMLADLFEQMGYKAGLISTVTYRIGSKHYNSTHTTPDTLRLNALLRQMVDEGCEYCFMEVSSHSVVQDRIAGLTFAGAVFTNLTHDHLDYHGTFAEYLKAKKGLFDSLSKSAFALVNIDDKNGDVMLQNCAAKKLRYSLRSMADYRAKVVEMHFDGMMLQLQGEELWARILGRFNAYNLLAAYGVAEQFGISKEEILVALSQLGAVSGRFEHFAAPGDRTVIVDYAHTPDALKSVLNTIDEICGGSGRGVVTICGCGGDRDKSKRGDMARIAYQGSSLAIFTSDNPRSEDPEAILAEMIDGVKSEPRSAERRWLKITDRAEAIRTAIMMSNPGDVILIAGKGHETYQIIGSTKIDFDDRVHARAAIEQYL
ncbi:MAG: UDP-N-acetylmuramoyl-L-alanyl-D-glutamate--2,6-diaminopimelate ligase [Rikenellaceae bacterium]